MMPETPEQVRVRELEETVAALKREWDTAKQNILTPALVKPGTLRFGGNVMQLDENGMQVETGNSQTIAIYFVGQLVASPSGQSQIVKLVGMNSSSQAYIGLTAGLSDETEWAGAEAERTSTQAIAASTAIFGGLTSRVSAHATNSAAYVEVQGDLRAVSTISPEQITGDVNNYSPSGLGYNAVLRLSSDATRNITGLAGGASGRVLLTFNVGSQNIVFKDESASSDEANRFALAGADLTLASDEGASWWYDTTSSRWRCFGKYA